MKIVFRSIRAEDFRLIEIWQSAPHVVEAWGNSDFEELYEQYVFRSSQGSVEQFVIEADSKPIGYFQFYWASQVGDGWWDGYDDATVGIDFYIGEVEWLGRGAGLNILEEAKKLLFAKPEVERIIADPSPSNERIIRLLAKVGFCAKGQIETPDGPALLMELHR